MTTPAEDEFTELIDADIPRVDLVDKAANGMTFLIAKRADSDQAGLMDPGFVRDLIGKTADPAPEPAPAADDTVTMTGSPAAIAKLIHAAAIRKHTDSAPTYEQIVKAKYSADDLKRMAGNGEAMKDGSYPIADREDLSNAIRAVGRGGADHDAIRRHIEARAKALGASSDIPDDWAADGSIKKGQDMADDTTSDLDPTVILAEPDQDAPGDPNTPGSPAWEAIDAATARKWTAILSRAKSALAVMSDREMLEAASADPDDYDSALDLDDAACAIDYAISVLAPFAVDEQAEVDCGIAEMDAIGKALATFDPAPLDVIESLTHVKKAGRTLSAANEQAIRHAVQSLEKVLASLPAAPDTQESGQEVAKKETAMPEGIAPETVDTPAAVESAAVEPVGKADGDTDGKAPMVAVYDAKGKLVGIVDPTEITPISGADAGDDDTSDTGDAGDADAAPSDLDPAPAADAGSPAGATDDDVTKTTTEDAAHEGDDVTKTTDTDSDDVLKSSITELVKSLLEGHSAAQTEEITKTRDAVLELAGAFDVLKGQVKRLEEQPAEPAVFANGQVPPAHMLRGQDRGAAPTGLAKSQAAELRKQLYSGSAAEQNEAATTLNAAAIDALAAIHQQRQQ